MGCSLSFEECSECLLHVLFPEEAVIGEASSQGLCLAGVGLQVSRDLGQGAVHRGVRGQHLLVALLHGRGGGGVGGGGSQQNVLLHIHMQCMYSMGGGGDLKATSMLLGYHTPLRTL